MSENLITVPLADYVKEVGGFAAAGRVFGITGEGVKKRLDTGQTVHVRVDPATRSAKDLIIAIMVTKNKTRGIVAVKMLLVIKSIMLILNIIAYDLPIKFKKATQHY